MSDRHVNIHYNRAHIKNYTSLIFKSDSPYRKFAVRRAMDDEAYLRCWTSEGFSRPIHTPFRISSESLQFKLPSSDYPQDSGYVSPGVILLGDNMKGSCLLWVMSTEISVDIAVETQSIVGRQSVDTRSTVGR